MEQGNIEQALETYRMAAEITPGCILRLQHCGTLAFYGGDSATGTRMLERTWAIGSKSRLFDVLSMMLLSFLRFDALDAKALDVSCEVLTRFSGQYPQSLRLRRMALLGAILCGLRAGKVGHHVQLARELMQDIARPDMDMEAATNLLSLWSRLDQFGVEQSELQSMVTRVARRFAASKAATHVLAAAVRRHPDAQGWIKQAQAEIQALAEQAMNHAVHGDPTAAVTSLLDHGEATGNAKLIEMASLVARRHEERIGTGLEALMQRSQLLARRYCAPVSHIAGVRRSNRSAGGLVLRRAATPDASPRAPDSAKSGDGSERSTSTLSAAQTTSPVAA